MHHESSQVDKLATAAFCRRRLSVVMVRLKMAETLREACTFIEQVCDSGCTAHGPVTGGWCSSNARDFSGLASTAPDAFATVKGANLCMLQPGNRPYGAQPPALATPAHPHRVDLARTQGHVRVGPETVTDPAFHVTRNMEDFVTWVDTSKIKRKVLAYNDKLDDYDLLQ